MSVSLDRALAWRLRRHHLAAGSRADSVAAVVSRLGAVPMGSGDPQLAIRRRLTRPDPDAVTTALDRGDVIRTYAFRGAIHLLAADEAGAYMAVRGASRQWELRSWQDHYDLHPRDWPALREVVREAVADGPLTRTALIDAVSAKQRFRHLRPGLADPSHTLLKPFAWQGDICFAPSRDGEMTYQSPATSPRWQGIPDLEEAGPQVLVAFLAGYGPVTRANLDHWLLAGLSAGKRRLEGWLGRLVEDGTVVEVDVAGEAMLHLDEHLDSLLETGPIEPEVTLLPGLDQWVMGPGTADERIVPAVRRSPVSRGANLALHDGVVSGTWTLAGDTLTVGWYAEAGDPPRVLIERELTRLAGLVGRDLYVTVTVC